MGWKSFTKIPNGTQVLNHGYDQCVALANRYHEGSLGLPFVPVASAYQWWTRFGEFSQLRDNYVKSDTPVAGALFVARGGIYNLPDGHIGVVTGVREGGFATMEQNTGDYAPQRYVYRRFRVKDANVYGFLIPKDNPAVDAATANEEDGMTPFSTSTKRKTAQKIQANRPTRVILNDDGEVTPIFGPGHVSAVSSSTRLKGNPGVRVEVTLAVEDGENKLIEKLAFARATLDGLGLASVNVTGSVYLKAGHRIRTIIHTSANAGTTRVEEHIVNARVKGA